MQRGDASVARLSHPRKHVVLRVRPAGLAREASTSTLSARSGVLAWLNSISSSFMPSLTAFRTLPASGGVLSLSPDGKHPGAIQLTCGSREDGARKRTECAATIGPLGFGSSYDTH